MIDKNSWSRYIDLTSGGVFNSVIADRIDVDASTVGRWRTGVVDPKPRQVVAYARAFGLSPLQALVAAGYLTEDEVDLPVAPPKGYALDEFSSLQLAEELVQRLAGAEDSRVTTFVGEPVRVTMDGRGHLRVVEDEDLTAEDMIDHGETPDLTLPHAADNGPKKADVEAADERPEPAPEED